MKRTLFICTGSIIAASVYIQATLIPISPLYRDRTERTAIEHQPIDYSHLCIVINSLDDAIMTVRLAPILHAQGKQICTQADPSLQLLLHMSPHITRPEAMQTITHSCSIDELIPAVRGHEQATQTEEFLKLDSTLVELWHDAFAHHDQCRVGLYLAKRAGTFSLLTPSLSVTDFMPCTMFKHIELFTFDDISNLDTKQHMTLHYFKPTVRTQPQHCAAIINELDLLITTCPSMAALAWMLKKPVWLIQPENISTKAYNDYFPGVEYITYNNDTTSCILSDIIERLAHLEVTPREKIITTEVQIGELIDKMTILEIKTERIHDAKKLANIWRELATIRATFEQHIPQSPELEKLTQELKAANEAMWQTEDRIRDKEREKCFDDEFIRLARAIYMQNDERCRVKRVINELLGSRLIEEKSYKPY